MHELMLFLSAAKGLNTNIQLLVLKIWIRSWVELSVCTVLSCKIGITLVSVSSTSIFQRFNSDYRVYQALLIL
jgi:hypothetical protein